MGRTFSAGHATQCPLRHDRVSGKLQGHQSRQQSGGILPAFQQAFSGVRHDAERLEQLDAANYWPAVVFMRADGGNLRPLLLSLG